MQVQKIIFLDQDLFDIFISKVRPLFTFSVCEDAIILLLAKSKFSKFVLIRQICKSQFIFLAFFNRNNDDIIQWDSVIFDVLFFDAQHLRNILVSLNHTALLITNCFFFFGSIFKYGVKLNSPLKSNVLSL